MDDQEPKIELVDTHCHIQSAGRLVGEKITREIWAKSPEISGDNIIERAKQVGVDRLICVGCDLPDSQLAIEFATNRDNCWATIGIHPHEAKRYIDDPAARTEFESLAAKPKVVAVGECGLDYFYEHSPKENQIAILKYQFELALSNDLPMIFHVREAYDDFWPIYDSYNSKAKPIRGVLHSFTDDSVNLEKGLERNLFIGVNGIVTFAKTDTQRAVYRSIPLSNLVLETDAPFLTPAPYRGTINESKYICVIAEFIAKLQGGSFEMLAKATTDNARTLFGVK
jgi:TatD DNase family protein